MSSKLTFTKQDTLFIEEFRQEREQKLAYLEAEVKLVGSMSRNTGIRLKSDADFFIQTPVNEDDLEQCIYMELQKTSVVEMYDRGG